MTDLDRKIAEFKGIELGPTGIYRTPGEFDKGIWIPSGPPVEDVLPSWSTDTAKAFELVDEVGSPFMLTKNHPINKDGDCLNGCYMSFWVDGVWLGQGTHPTVPEAICRAYIALKEWERGRDAKALAEWGKTALEVMKEMNSSAQKTASALRDEAKKNHE